ncbi:DUF2325 domain-containing protein [Lactobacillus sp. ESL0791]|uniref:DUF2325 domain-containing protein n=1 Tax=Lactobacillus sp. ESL0791 TaxID=2983234 RepID=UPI0023F76758|nr:DUF2325 domain-containing protein [Lactobacillus sp. ESL0791]MDF7638697.1 DUF2325 domain-containing protein [Lactobacillus sp. ESL0791]
MFDYRNNLKTILNKTAGDDKSLRNGIAAINAIIKMTADGEEPIEPSSEPNKTKQNNLAIPFAGQKEVKALLVALAELIQSPGSRQAKEQALTKLHQLTFVPKVGKEYGKELGQLDRAIQASVATKETVNQQIFEQALKPKKPVKRDYRKGKRYTVIRLLAGCDLINDDNRRVFTLKESQIHSLNLKSGDIVEAIAEENNPNYEATILRVVGFRELASTEFDKIITFKYGVVQGRPGHLAVSRNIKGEKLRVRGKAVLLPVDASNFQESAAQLVDGAIVDLAWYDGDVRLKKNPADAIKLRWIYQVDRPKAKTAQKKKKAVSSQDAAELSKLDMDLHYQRVGIAVGDNQNEAMLEGIVNRYHGIPIPIDAFQGKKKVIENQLKDLDIVILVTAFAAHDSTWNIREFASKYGVRFAVSSSKGYQAFERALYRAANGLPAYEGNQTIDYRIMEENK